MAKGIKIKEEFVRLRAEGRSFNQISVELEVSKPRLLKWSVELRHQIDSLQLLRYEGLMAQYEAMKEDRLTLLAATRQRLLQELRTRDFKDVPTDKLIKLIQSAEQRIFKELASVSHLERTGFDNEAFEEAFSTRIRIG